MRGLMKMKNILPVVLTLVLIVLVACQPLPVVPEEPGEEITLPEIEIPELEQEEEVIPEPELFDEIIEVTEKDLVELNPEAVDPDGDTIYYTFSDPFTEEGVWQTEVGDEGEYVITITASDGELEVEMDVYVIVHAANKPPVIAGPDELYFNEGDIVELVYDITDPDGDEVIVSYSGWMLSDMYQTTFEDEGDYDVKITAQDAEHETVKEIVVHVMHTNRAPIIDGIDELIELTEGETLEVVPDAVDPDGDEVTFTFSEPLNDEGIWRSADGDAGEFFITVTASDGEMEASFESQVIVYRRNQAPVVMLLGEAENLVYEEGDMIDLLAALDITDEEGDDVTVEFSGFMETATYQTTFDDEGTYDQTVIATDAEGNINTFDFEIVIENVNRAPVFVLNP